MLDVFLLLGVQELHNVSFCDYGCIVSRCLCVVKNVVNFSK